MILGIVLTFIVCFVISIFWTIGIDKTKDIKRDDTPFP